MQLMNGIGDVTINIINKIDITQYFYCRLNLILSLLASADLF